MPNSPWRLPVASFVLRALAFCYHLRPVVAWPPCVWALRLVVLGCELLCSRPGTMLSSPHALQAICCSSRRWVALRRACRGPVCYVGVCWLALACSISVLWALPWLPFCVGLLSVLYACFRFALRFHWCAGLGPVCLVHTCRFGRAL